MDDDSPLDNPIWWALNTAQRPLKRGDGLAARFPPDISRLSGMASRTVQAFDDLAALTPNGDTAALFTAMPLVVPPGWQVLRTQALEQMVCGSIQAADAGNLVQLGSSDILEMLALTAQTEPGPFSEGTIRMGRYLGIRATESKQLAAMAGERLRLNGFTEISAVCTDPGHRGRGYGGKLVTALCSLILADGSTPFLHVKNDNGAKRLYESIGFRTRREIQLTVVKRIQQ